MEHCINHPDRETSYRCLKHEISMCKECLRCRDPELYCKFRSACAIHFMTKRKKNLEEEPKVKETADS